MSSIITIAGEKLFAAKAQANQQLDIDTFIFANIPDQDPAQPIDRNEGMPVPEHIVHQQVVQQVGRINENVVVYSTVLSSTTGPFEFNWVGLYSSVNQTLIAINHVPKVAKTVTGPGIAGNTLNRNFGIEYSGIADLTGINVAPETWQLDFTARLSGMDELHRQLASDMNGEDWFIEEGFKVVPRATINSFSVTPGVGYVSGLRVELQAEHMLMVQIYPQFVYVDAWFDGTASSMWKPQVKFTLSNDEVGDYVDDSGVNHYVRKVAEITSAGDVTDLRKIDGIKGQIETHVGNNFTRKFDTRDSLKKGVDVDGNKVDFERMVGNSIEFLGYYVPLDGGGNKGVIRKGEHVEDYGLTISLSENIYVECDASRTSAKSFGITGHGDETERLQEFFNSSRLKRELVLDVDVFVNTTKNVVPNTDPRPPIDEGDSSSAGIVINHPVKCHSLHKVTALGGGDSQAVNNYLFSTNTDGGINLSFEINGNRYNAPGSSLGVQVNNKNVETKMWGGEFGGSPLVLNGHSRSEPLQGQKHDGHEYDNVGNSLFCRYVKDMNANNWVLNNVSEGLDLDKTCDGVNTNDWIVRSVRGSGADAAIEFNGAKNCNANNLTAIDFKTGIMINAKERYDEPGVFDRTENCNATNATIINCAESSINFGNVTGDHTDAMNCSVDDATIVANSEYDAVVIGGQNVSCRRAKIKGGKRSGILARGGEVNLDFSEAEGCERHGIDVLPGTTASAKHVKVKSCNKAGGYNGLNIQSGASANILSAEVSGAHEHSVRHAGNGELVCGLNQLSGGINSDFRVAGSTEVVRLASGSGEVHGSNGLKIGSNRKVYYGSKDYVATSSLDVNVGDIIEHVDAVEVGDYQGRVCYGHTGSVPQFRMFGKVE